MLSLRQLVPWWGKIAAKTVLSRLPISYSTWQSLGIFRHGEMDKAQYALGIFQAHAKRAGLFGELAGKTILELGCGDSVASAVIAHAYGARAVLVDVGAFAKRDLASYLPLIGILNAKGLRAVQADSLNSLEDLLNACQARYLTNGVGSLRGLQDESVDLIFSEAVLEHVRKSAFATLMRECARVLKPGGICSHRVDLQDHLGGGLNNLRFSQRVWESEFFARSGFYTNRIQFNSMLALFRDAGFTVSALETRRWSSLPINRKHLAREFQDVSDTALNVSGFDVLLQSKL